MQGLHIENDVINLQPTCGCQGAFEGSDNAQTAEQKRGTLRVSARTSHIRFPADMVCSETIVGTQVSKAVARNQPFLDTSTHVSGHRQTLVTRPNTVLLPAPTG